MTAEGEYRFIVAEIISAPCENSRHKIRAQPLPDQWASPDYRIECPLEIRKKENIGQLYKFWAKFKSTSNSTHLYTSYKWSPEKVSPEQATAFIKAKEWW